MSIPRNHHFVSQIHIKQFINNKENCIYIYDKKKKNFFTKSTTKSLFSEKDSNTKFINGVKDYSSLEEELNKYFEKDFQRNINNIKQIISCNCVTEEIEKSLKVIAQYGIIGEIRTSQHKTDMDNTILDTLKLIKSNCVPELKEEIDNLFCIKQETKYFNLISYVEISKKILDKMGDLIFEILIPEDINDYFFLPDCSAFTSREKINEYFNPDIQEIAYIGLPLTSKMYINIWSSKLEKNNISFLKYRNVPTSCINEINSLCVKFCHSKVACENEDYLRNFIMNLEKF